MRPVAMIVAGALVVLTQDGVRAMPTPLVIDTGVHSMTVRDGCGFGAHLGRYGGCRLNRGWRGRLRGAIGEAPRGCPPGTRPIGRGFCRRDAD